MKRPCRRPNRTGAKRRRPGTRLSNAPVTHAEVLALQNHRRSLRGQRFVDGVGDLRGELLLDLQTLCEGVHDAGDLREAVVGEHFATAVDEDELMGRLAVGGLAVRDRDLGHPDAVISMIGELAVYLASDSGSWITGQVFRIDGGAVDRLAGESTVEVNDMEPLETLRLEGPGLGGGVVEIGPGDEVILPAWTWYADYDVIVLSGALPVFAEIDDSFNIDRQRVLDICARLVDEGLNPNIR